MRRLFVDMDGVLADFDSGYEAIFGVRPCKKADNVDWKAVNAHRDFYAHLPPMPDLDLLWRNIAHLKPTVLTGIPLSIGEAPANKRAWIHSHLGVVPVITCPSRDKSLYSRPGDVLIDDWDKYRDLWLGRGGVWVAHRSAITTIDTLHALGMI